MLASDLTSGVESTLWIANAAVGGLTAPPIFQLTVGRKSHLDTPRAVAGTDWQSLIKRIVRTTRNVLWSSTSEVAFYLANSATSARRAANAIRHHWHVENTLHYTRDVTFQEDRSRIRNNSGVFARLDEHFKECVHVPWPPVMRPVFASPRPRV